MEKLLDANDINVEYRFYGKSLPDSIPWEYLTIEQATADLHAINQLFRNIYHGKWVSTGISKGGDLQYHGDCAGIPLGESLDSCLTYLMKISEITAFSDEGIKEFEAHYYQAATQSGYYGYQVAPFKKYLHYLDPNGPNPSATFPPKSAAAKAFDPTLNARVADWLARDGNNIIYIYGGIDAWTAAGIVPSDKVNSKRFVVPGATHSTARVQHMDAEMREQYVNAVKKLGGLDAHPEALE